MYRYLVVLFLLKYFEENWDFYYSNKKEDFITFYEDYYEKIKEVYTKNFNYLKLLTELNYVKSNKWISIIAIAISVIAIIISLCK